MMILQTIAKTQPRALELRSMIESPIWRRILTGRVAEGEGENPLRIPLCLTAPRLESTAVRLEGPNHVRILRSITTILITTGYIDIPRTPVKPTKSFALATRSRAKETIARRKSESSQPGRRLSREWLSPISKTILDLQDITVLQTNGVGVADRNCSIDAACEGAT
jgi:hypothetical protein